MIFHGKSFKIEPVSDSDCSAVLEVYRQCEDFLVLGPVPSASMEMVLTDMRESGAEGGCFCGIYNLQGEMTGILDYMPSQYQGDQQKACISLLMIAIPHRNCGTGRQVVATVETFLKDECEVRSVFTHVQTENLRALRFWNECGYHRISDADPRPDGTTVYHLCKYF